MCIPSSASRWSYLSYHNIALKGLFQKTGGAWINFVNLQGIIASSIFEDVSDAAVLLSIWYLYESQAKNLLPKEKVSRAFLAYSVLKSLFIHPLDEVTITHRVLISLLRVFVSRFAFLNTINGFNFIPSAFADTFHYLLVSLWLYEHLSYPLLCQRPYPTKQMYHPLLWYLQVSNCT